MLEKIYYQDREINISSLRATIKGSTYPLNQITAVHLTSDRPHIPIAVLTLFVSCFIAFMAYTHFFGFADMVGGEFEATPYVLASAFLFVVSLLLFSLQYHCIEIERSSGRTKAIKSRDYGYAVRVRDALNSALVHSSKA